MSGVSNQSQIYSSASLGSGGASWSNRTGPIGPAGPRGLSGNTIWQINGNDIYYNTGNVGIGTTNPEYTLDISGTLRVSGNVLFNSDVDFDCNLLNEVSAINFCDGTYIGPGSSFDISTNQVLKIIGNTGLSLILNKARDLLKVDGTQPGNISKFDEGFQTLATSSSAAAISVNCFDHETGQGNVGRLTFRDFNTGNINSYTSNTINNEYLAYINWQGVDNNIYKDYSRIQTKASSTGQGGIFEFYTKPDNSSKTNLNMVINEKGDIGIGTQDPSALLHLYDTQYTNGSIPLRIENTNTANICGVQFKDSSTVGTPSAIGCSGTDLIFNSGINTTFISSVRDISFTNFNS